MKNELRQGTAMRRRSRNGFLELVMAARSTADFRWSGRMHGSLLLERMCQAERSMDNSAVGYSRLSWAVAKVLGMKTLAKLDGDSFVLNGAKMWITNGTVDGALTVQVATTKGRHVAL
eukprot:784538-Amphidinium_carterae.2